MRQRITWPLIIIVSALSAGISSFGFLPVILQFLAVGWFIFVIPGMAYVRMIRMLRPLPLFILAVSLSIALATFVSMFMVLTHTWYPLRGLYFLIAISILGAVLQFTFTPDNQRYPLLH
jgi:hypothetical protein